MAVSDAGLSRIFISYRRADASWPARWLADQLSRQFGEGVVFQDVDSIQPGDDFAAEIEAAVAACSVLLVVIGPQWLVAEGAVGRRLDDPQDWVRLEIEAAIKRRVRVIPVLVDGARMPSASELPPSLWELARRQAVTLNPASLDTRRLVSVLETALHRQTEQLQTGTRAPESPRPTRSRAGRLLTRAANDATALTGEAKARALAEVIPAAAVAAPERAAWLSAEAEAGARSIEDASARWSVLTSVAAAVAAADPQHAEAIARSIEDASWQSNALVGVAGVVAAGDPQHAEAIARSISSTFLRSRALAGVAAAVAAADPQHAEAIARSIEDASWRSRALAGVAGAVAAADPERALRLSIEAETAARLSEDWGALVGAAGAVAAADPERAAWLSIEAETAARSIEDALSRWSTLAYVARVVAAADPQRAEAIARSIEDLDWRSNALADVAGAVAAADPQRAEAIARSIEDLSWRFIALTQVAKVVVIADPERAEALACSIEDVAPRSYALADLARLLAQPDRLKPV
jgi:TIR domain